MTKRLLIKLLADAAGKIQQNFSAPTVVTLYAAPRPAHQAQKLLARGPWNLVLSGC